MQMDTKDHIRDITVSVVIPFCEAYTPKSSLKQAIQSVHDQAIQTDIIIVEDPEQQGPAWARNEGLKKASTRYVAFLDADDLWKHSKLERQLAKMQHQDVGLCVEGPDMDLPDFIVELLLGDLKSHTSSIVIDTEKVTTRFRRDLIRFEDRFFMIECASESGVCLCNDLVCVRKHADGLSASGSLEEKLKSRLKVASYLEDLLDQHGLANRYRSYAYYAYGRGQQLAGRARNSVVPLCKSLQYNLSFSSIAALMLSPLLLIRDSVNYLNI